MRDDFCFCVFMSDVLGYILDIKTKRQMSGGDFFVFVSLWLIF